MGATRITQTASQTPQFQAKRVAAYARISEVKGNTPASLSAQVSRYNDLITSTPGWVFAGVYADAGLSGTTKNRPQFQQLLQACEDGQVDLVLTKSISRFARNTVDLLEVVRHLKELGVEVMFERENIRTFSGDGELMLSILASFAQEEARSVSENVKWGIRKRFKQGITNQMCVYGYTWTGEEFLINEEQARVVRYIYRRFLEGASYQQMLRELDEQGVRGYWGAKMNTSTLRNMLRQERYTGNSLLQKTFNAYPGDHGTKNEGQMPQYWVENTHPAIIPMETWTLAQEEMERRNEAGRKQGRGVTKGKKMPRTALSKKIRCERCGTNYRRTSIRCKGGRDYAWVCGSGQDPTVPSCPGHMRETLVKAHIAAAMGWAAFDETLFKRQVDHLEVTAKNRFTIVATNGERHDRFYKPVTKAVSIQERVRRIMAGTEGSAQ